RGRTPRLDSWGEPYDETPDQEAEDGQPEKTRSTAATIAGARTRPRTRRGPAGRACRHHPRGGSVADRPHGEQHDGARLLARRSGDRRVRARGLATRRVRRASARGAIHAPPGEAGPRLLGQQPALLPYLLPPLHGSVARDPSRGS